MKKYNRAQEKRKDLISVINYTTLDEYDKAAKKITGCRSKGKQKGSGASGRVTQRDRKDDGKRRHQPRRSGSQNWCSKIQREQDNATEIFGKLRLFSENGRKHRPQRRIKDQEIAGINEGDFS